MVREIANATWNADMISEEGSDYAKEISVLIFTVTITIAIILKFKTLVQTNKTSAT